MKQKKSLNTSKSNSVQRERRYFSEAARRAIVKEIETENLSKAEAARKYKVSTRSIHKWIAKYSDKYQPPLVKVVEHQSDSEKNKQLSAELSKTYELLGRLQAQNALLQQIIDQASEHYEIDLKKNFATKP